MKKMKLVVGAAVFAAAALAASANAQTIKIGVGVDPMFSAIYLAAQDKMFAKAGLNVEIVQYEQGGPATDAVVAGQVHLTAAGEPTAMVRMARADVRALSVLMDTGRIIKLVAKNGISDVKQLKKIGIVPGTVSEYSTGKLLEKNGIDKASVQLVRSGPPELPALLARGDVDAYFAWEPWPTMGVRQGGKIIVNAPDVGYPGVSWLLASGAWVDANQATVKNVVKVLADACDIIRADLNKGATATQAVVKLPAAQALEILKDMECRVRDFQPADFQSYDGIAAFLAEQKATPTLLDYRKFLATGLVGK